MKKLVLSLVISMFFISCQDETIEPEAKIITENELRSQPGYAWFDIEVGNYTPDASKTNQIKTLFDKNKDTILIFVKPSCSCTGTQKQFPQLIKVLKESGVPSTNYKIYSMSASNIKHEYNKLLVLNDLPGFFLVKNSVPVYSMNDTITYRKVTNPAVITNIPMEQIFLESLISKK